MLAGGPTLKGKRDASQNLPKGLLNGSWQVARVRLPKIGNPVKRARLGETGLQLTVPSLFHQLNQRLVGLHQPGNASPWKSYGRDGLLDDKRTLHAEIFTRLFNGRRGIANVVQPSALAESIGNLALRPVGGDEPKIGLPGNRRKSA